MKRGQPLKRRTPLVARTPLRTLTPLTSRCELRRTPLAPFSAKRIEANGIRRLYVSAMREAARGACARCGRRDVPVHGHERLARAQGGDILTPDCLLCPECNGWCEDEPKLAAWTGWKVSSKWPHDHTLSSSQAWRLDGTVVEFTVAGAVGVDPQPKDGER